MSRDSELLAIVKLHKEWLDSDNKAGKRADLSGANLDGADLSNVDLSGAIIRGASLVGTNLKSSRLFHTDFSDANLKGANLSYSSLILTNFSGADLTLADLRHTKEDSSHEYLGKNKRGPRFTDANLTQAKMDFSYCYKSDFSGTTLEGASFEGANLEGCHLKDNDLSRLNFSKAKLIHAELSSCLFSGSKLENTQLSGANMRGANLTHANICGANLRSANLEKCKVDGIKYNRKSLFRGIRLAGCYGSSRFKRFAEDQDYIEEFKEAHPMAYIVWHAITDCGRSMVRVALWSQTLSILFGIIYYSLGAHAFEISNPEGLQWNLFTTIYYSVVTFTTLGFGDITPNTPLAASIVIIEVIIGYVMLGILISILATKVARRS